MLSVCYVQRTYIGVTPPTEGPKKMPWNANSPAEEKLSDTYATIV